MNHIAFADCTHPLMTPHDAPDTRRSDSGPTADRSDTHSDDLLDMAQAIELLQTSRPTFYRWLRAGKIKGMKVGRQWRFRRDDLHRFLAGDAPRVDLPVSIQPLIEFLTGRLRDLGGQPAELESAPDTTEHAVERILELAVQMGASDVSLALHPTAPASGLVATLRVRLGGVMHTVTEVDTRLVAPLTEQFKMLALCDPHETKRPQHSRVAHTVQGRQMWVWVSLLPTVQGETVNVRLLDQDQVVLDLDKVGLADDVDAAIREATQARSGLVIVNGPTGSGKTTTLYCALLEIDGSERKIMSVENPVEFLLPWVIQTQVDLDSGLDFGAALRAMLRMDPDVIMAGEIRTDDDARLLADAARTGRLVLTCLHAKDAVGALLRYADLIHDPLTMADATRLIVSQLLVRKLDPEHSRPADPPARQLETAERLARDGGLDWDALPKTWREPVPDPARGITGYRGRTAINEALTMTRALATALREGTDEDELRRLAVAEGMTTLAADGIRRAANGETSLEEVFRVLAD